MRMTMGKALLADIICWTLLTYLMYAVGWLIPAVLVASFAIIYNGRNALRWLRFRRAIRMVADNLYDDDDEL